MARAQPTFLWRYIIVELWKLIALSTGVLVAVIAFAAAIKPLADGKLTPSEALKFMGLAVVPMLQYALPFAAGFAATIAYHRLSHDNELLAAHAGGISHRSVLAPAAISGVLLSLVLLGLLEVAIPRFLQSMERLITLDAAKLIVNSVERGQAVEIKGNLIYADRAQRLTPSRESGAHDELVLLGVAGARLDKQGHVVSHVTAASGRAWFFANTRGAEGGEPGRAGQIVIRLRNALFMDQDHTLAFADEWSTGISTPPGLSDNPKFLTHSELDELNAHPEHMDWIEQRRYDLAVHLGERLTTGAVDRALRERNEVSFVDDDGRRYRLRAGALVWAGQSDLRWNVAPVIPGSAIEIDLVRSSPDDAGAPTTQHIAAHSVGLYTDIGGRDRAERRLTLHLEAEGVVTTGALPGAPANAAGERSRWSLQGLTPDPDPIAILTDQRTSPPSALLARAEPYTAGPSPDPFISAPAAELKESIERLGREVLSKQQERIAAAAACAVMVVSGAVTAVSLSQSLPLTVYLWSFFPALATTILISSGQQVTHEKGPVGLLVLWGGVGVLGLYALLGYWRLARH